MTNVLLRDKFPGNTWVQCFHGVVCNDHTAQWDNKLANLQFGIRDCITRNSGIGGTVKSTEEDVFTPV